MAFVDGKCRDGDGLGADKAALVFGWATSGTG